MASISASAYGDRRLSSHEKRRSYSAFQKLLKKILSLLPWYGRRFSWLYGEDMDAFDELAPPASSSPSKPMKTDSYHVFINHRGQDVKSSVAALLYAMLTRCHLSVFLDEPELKYGDFFPQKLQEAMSSAQVHIAIFSEKYAESPWCLAELSFMLKSGSALIPIFYHVDPTDLRRVQARKGKYVDAFDGYVRNSRYLGKLNEWKKALYKASFYKGEIIKNKDDEDRQLRDIVNTVLKIVQKESSWVAEHPGGIINRGNNSGIISTGDGNVQSTGKINYGSSSWTIGGKK